MAEDRHKLGGLLPRFPTAKRRHKAVAATLRALRRGEQGQHGGARSSGQGVFNVRAHPDTLQRIGNFLDLLLETAKSNGFKLVQLDDALGLKVAGEHVPISISQTIIRTRHKVTRLEKRRLESWQQRSRTMSGIGGLEDCPDIPAWDFRPTGEMKFEIGGWPRPRGLTHVFKDTRTRKIEERMPEIVSSLEAHARFLTHEQALAARSKQRREEADRRRAQQQHEARLEQQRMDFLESKLAALSRLEKLERLLSRAGTSGTRGDATFVRWVEGHINDLATQVSLEAMVSEADELPAFKV